MLKGSDIKRMRKQLGMDARTFARFVGVSEAAVSRWENGLRGVSSLAERAICQAIEQGTGRALRRVSVAAKR